ncbi:MAG: transcriptional repressor [Methanomassiliicoccales archaeon]|nr:MAG: transcriptional repressor [Methanomassiliicoccales archaeon]
MNGKATRWTKQLKVIVDTIYESTNPMTADEVYHHAKEKLPNISLGTVYRNLNKLLAEGLISETNNNGVSLFFRHPFPNSTFECSRCHRLTSIPLDLNVLEMSRKIGMKIEKYSLHVVGTCKECESKCT